MENNNFRVVVCLLGLHLILCIHATDHPDEVAALIAFKNNLTKPSEKCDLSSWVATMADASLFFYVQTNDDKSVSRIDLGNCELEGPLVPDLGTLKNLQHLELYTNKLNGSIPEEFGSLTELRTLDLYENTLVGLIPYQLGNLKNLISIPLNNNDLSGQVPSAWSTLETIQLVDLSNNPQLCGWNTDKKC